MKITVQCAAGSSTLTVPKKFQSVSEIVSEFLKSKVGKQCFGDDEDLVIFRNGVSLAKDANIKTALSDGDFLKFLKKEEAEASAFCDDDRFFDYGVAKQLTKKAEDFVLATEASWRGIAIGWFAVCDGHGGQQAASSAKDTLLPHFLSALDRRASSNDDDKVNLAKLAPVALKDAFEEVDAAITSTSGSTATVSVILPSTVLFAASGLVDSEEECVLVVTANVGDSLAVIEGNNKLRFASHDHRLERNTAEQQRCTLEGGVISRDEPNKKKETSTKKPLRLWPGGLMMSRALGDRDAKQAVPTPEIRCVFVGGGRARLVIASDGLWDELSPKAALKLANNSTTPQAAAKTLADDARKRGLRRNDTDDVAVVVVDLGGESNDTVLSSWDPTFEDGIAGASLDAALAEVRRLSVKRAAKAKEENSSFLGLATNPCHFFDAVRVVGTGGFGKVLLCDHRLTGAPVAIKVMTKAALRRKKHERRARVERDALLALSSDCPLVISLSCSWHTETAVYLAMPYVGGGDLYEALEAQGRLPPASAAYYCGQVLRALAFTHAKGVLHRDVKPENVLLDDQGHAVLIDLGLARPAPFTLNDRALTRCGTDDYWSPEMVKRDHYGTSTDLWSASVLLYELLHGTPPWRNISEEEAPPGFIEEEEVTPPGFLAAPSSSKKSKKKKVIQEQVQEPAVIEEKSQNPTAKMIHEAILTKTLTFPATYFDDGAKNLLSRCLERNISERLGVADDGFSADISAVCAHPWWRWCCASSSGAFAGGDDEAWWTALERRQLSPPPRPFPKTTATSDDDRTKAKKFLMPEVGADQVQQQQHGASRLETTCSRGSSKIRASGVHRESFVFSTRPDLAQTKTRDPYEGFDYGSPLSLEALETTKTAHLRGVEANMAPPTEAVSERSILATHAVARGFLARLEAYDRTEARDTIARALRGALRNIKLKRQLEALPKLRRAAKVAAKAAKRKALQTWLRYSTRLASFLAAKERQKELQADGLPPGLTLQEAPPLAPKTGENKNKARGNKPRAAAGNKEQDKETAKSRQRRRGPNNNQEKQQSDDPQQEESDRLRVGSRGGGRGRSRGRGRGRQPSGEVPERPSSAENKPPAARKNGRSYVTTPKRDSEQKEDPKADTRGGRGRGRGRGPRPLSRGRGRGRSEATTPVVPATS